MMRKIGFRRERLMKKAKKVKKAKKAKKVQKMDLGAIFDAHIRHEFVDHDIAATMKTMAAEPYVHNVPTLTGGDGHASVVDFYTHHFVGKMPADTRIRVRRGPPMDARVGVDEGQVLALLGPGGKRTMPDHSSVRRGERRRQSVVHIVAWFLGSFSGYSAASTLATSAAPVCMVAASTW